MGKGHFWSKREWVAGRGIAEDAEKEAGQESSTQRPGGSRAPWGPFPEPSTAYPREVGQRCWRFNEVEKEARESTEKEEQIGDGQMISRQGELGGPDSGQETVTTQPRGRVEGAWELRKQEPGGLEEAISPAGYPQCRAGVWGLWSTCS